MTETLEVFPDVSTRDKRYAQWTNPASYSYGEFEAFLPATDLKYIEDQHQIPRAWTLVGPQSNIGRESTQIGQQAHIHQAIARAEARGGASVELYRQPVETSVEIGTWDFMNTLRLEFVAELEHSTNSVEIEASKHPWKMLIAMSYIIRLTAEVLTIKPDVYEMPDSGIVVDYSNKENRFIMIIEDDDINIMTKIGEQRTNSKLSLGEALSTGISSYIPSF